MNKRDKTRIVDAPVSIDSGSVLTFFDGRGRVFDPEHPYVSVLYQDRNVALAEERDAAEKILIKPLLSLKPTSRVLDLGCGIGRWADAISHEVEYYLGVDISEGLIAEANRRAAPNAAYRVMSLAEVSSDSLGVDNYFHRVIISGVLLYLNDDDLKLAMNNVPGLCAAECKIYIREPLAIEHRLTLDRHWSEELSAEYSAIYRTKVEMAYLLRKHFEPHGFELADFLPLYSNPKLSNRRETEQFFTIGSRGSY